MSGILIACWIVAGVTAGLHFLAHLQLSIYPIAALLPLNAREDLESDDDQATDVKMSPKSSYLLRLISISTLIVATVTAGIGLALALDEWAFLLGIVVSLCFKVLVNLTVVFLTRRYLPNLVKLMSPIVRALNRVSSLRLIDIMVTYGSTLPIKRRAHYVEVADFIKAGLHYLSQVHIPLDEKELRMIRGILRMDDVKVSEIMCPRPDIVALSLDSTVAAAIETMHSKGITKVPVYRNALDDTNNIMGVLYVLDLIEAMSENSTNSDLSRLLRPPLFVTEFQSVENLLREFKEKRTTIALVVDEHGGIDGLVTITDVMEEIVGEMMDEFDREQPEVQVVSPDEVVVDARISVDQLNQLVSYELKNDVDTVGGLIYRELDKMPSVGDSVKIGQLHLTIGNMFGRRIRRVKVKKVGEDTT